MRRGYGIIIHYAEIYIPNKLSCNINGVNG